MAQSSIEWTESSWNPVTGCTKVSPGCRYCYAERMARRLRGMGQPNYVHGFKVALHEHMLDRPLSWSKPQTIFVNSMSDLFHPEIPDDYVLKVFDVMAEASWHQFQVLTKRSDRLRELNPEISWPANVWMGVSVESRDYIYRIDNLRETAARVKFVSFEPLLGQVGQLNLAGIHWAIAGGESGPGARPMLEAWPLEIRDQCMGAGVAFFFKQWGGVSKKKAGRILEGRTWDALPLLQ